MTINLEVGKYYRDASGKIHGPMLLNSDTNSEYTFLAPGHFGGYSLWRANGVGFGPDCFLIEEVPKPQEPPHCPVEGCNKNCEAERTVEPLVLQLQDGHKYIDRSGQIHTVVADGFSAKYPFSESLGNGSRRYWKANGHFGSGDHEWDLVIEANEVASTTFVQPTYENLMPHMSRMPKMPLDEPQVPPSVPVDPAEEALKEALKIVTGARRKTYGTPENNFAVIAAFWNTYLNQRRMNTSDRITSHQPVPRALMRRGTYRLDGIDVAIMMDLMKTARLIESPNHKDSWVDKCGYSACGHRCASVDLPNTETDGSGTGD